MMNINTLMKRASSCAALLTLGMGMAFAQSDAVTYEVKAGDTLYGISSRYGISVDALKAANPAVGEDNIISIGQLLVIPSAEATVTTTTRTVTTPAKQTTQTTTTTVVTRYDVDNSTFVRGDMVVSAGLGLGSVKKRGAKADENLATFTQQLSVDYCVNDDILNGSALGLGLMINNSFGGKYSYNNMDFRRNDLTVFTTLSLHHQFVDNLDTYVKAGIGVGVLTDEYQTTRNNNYECTYANPTFGLAFMVGARYYLDSSWGIYLEAGLPAASFNKDFGSSFNFLSGGISYRF